MHLLLDFDGVIIRSHRIHRMIGKKCQAFTMKHTRRDVNKELYDSTGHTLLGLQKIVQPNISLKEFNRVIYHDIDYVAYLDNIQQEQKDHIHTVRELLKHTKDNKIPTYLFSNAPDYYCDAVSKQMKVPFIPYIPQHHLKPEPQAYKTIEIALQEADKFVFVDDKLINLVNTPQNDKWIRVWYSPETTQHPEKISDDFYIVPDLLDVVRMDGLLGK